MFSSYFIIFSMYITTVESIWDLNYFSPNQLLYGFSLLLYLEIEKNLQKIKSDLFPVTIH